MASWIVEPGFWSSAQVATALEVGALVAVVAAVVGVFVVLQSKSFAGHALTDVATAGGTGSVLLGWSTLAGFLVGGVLGASAIEAIGAERVKDRDLATGIVLGSAMGLSALFLYLTSTTTTSSGVTTVILFGSIFTVSGSVLPLATGLGVAVVLLMALCVRPLVLSSLSTELAVARGVRVRVVGWIFMAALAVAVGLASVAVGSILATALLIGPAATAHRLTTRLASTVVVASILGVASTWLGILLAYDSYYWNASHRNLPVSFFVVVLIVVFYAASLQRHWHSSRRDQPPNPTSRT